MIHKILNEQGENHILPFLWIHGEPAEVYREMVQAIYKANMQAFCVEARPHKEFGREQWWQDLEVIVSEAERLGMKVWILDDKHFPTGYANGGVEKAPVELHRQHLCRRQVKISGGSKVSLKLRKYIRPVNKYSTISKILFLHENNMRPPKKYKDDTLLSCTAYNGETYTDLSECIKDGQLKWHAPAGEWNIEIISLSRNTGMHRKYINMLDEESCQIQIREVYEPHYEHFKDRFGTVIAGFFSDEPELGNGDYTKHYNYLGTDQSLPYSRELGKELERALGCNWINQLPLLWNNDYDSKETAKVRYLYMDCVTRLVEKNFSRQIGEWCGARGVEYIGHVIEDNNQHARTSTSLGHYFRGLKYQHMAGIDVVSNQLLPGGEDKKERFILGYDNDGEFYHYALAKLGSSLGAVNPRMKGRTMCEIFGNYGWSLGVRNQKYLVDHFLVRGINHFVPHAFNSKEYPDKDCPPHFYAHGHNPQYRHFGELMAYTNRMCELLTDGKAIVQAAIWYHGEAEWCGKCMMMQKPARILQDNQIDFNFLPTDIFSETEFYHTEIERELIVNGRKHQILIIPYAQYIPYELAKGIVLLKEKGGDVLFIDALPEAVSTGEEIPAAVRTCEVISLDELAGYLRLKNVNEIELIPDNNRIRYIHYRKEEDIFCLVNEGDCDYEGRISLPVTSEIYGYDAWMNKVYPIDFTKEEGRTIVSLAIAPKKNCIIITGAMPQENNITRYRPEGEEERLTNFRQSVCRSIEYPGFSGIRELSELTSYSETDRKFSGYIRYQTDVNINDTKNVWLEITDAYEGTEVFVNGKSAGIQVIPPFQYDISQLCRKGENEILIEIATSLERERGKSKGASPTGIVGEVKLYQSKGEKHDETGI